MHLPCGSQPARLITLYLSNCQELTTAQIRLPTVPTIRRSFLCSRLKCYEQIPRMQTKWVSVAVVVVVVLGLHECEVNELHSFIVTPQIRKRTTTRSRYHKPSYTSTSACLNVPECTNGNPGFLQACYMPKAGKTTFCFTPNQTISSSSRYRDTRTSKKSTRRRWKGLVFFCLYRTVNCR